MSIVSQHGRVSFASLSKVVALVSVAGLTFLAGCGDTYRPVVSSINPVGPAQQPNKYAVAISSSGPTTPGLVTIVDFAGDTTLVTAAIGANPKYLQLESGGFEGYTLNGDGTINSFGVSPGLIASNIAQTTLPATANPVSILAQGSFVYIAEAGRNAVAQLTAGSPPNFKQELPTGAGTIYTVGVANAPRVYAIAQGAPGATGTVAAIETTSNTVSSTIPVGRGPVYGVMTVDGRRAFILNKTDGTVSVINAQTNALDTFTVAGKVTGTIPVGVAPVWADLAPSRNEVVVANAGDGSTAGSLTIINAPFCSQQTTGTSPNCDPANQLDAVGFGQVLANIPVGVNPIMVAVLADGTRAYVANAGNAAAGIAGSISVVSLDTNSVIATIPAANSSNLLDAVVHGHPGFIAVTGGTPTGKLYVTANDSTDLTIIRTDTDKVLTHVPLQGNGVMVRVSQP